MPRPAVLTLLTCLLLVLGAVPAVANESEPVETAEDSLPDGGAQLKLDESLPPNEQAVDFGVGGGSSPDRSRQADGTVNKLPPGWECETLSSIENDLVEPVHDRGLYADTTRFIARNTFNKPDGVETIQLTTGRLYSSTGRWTFDSCVGPNNESFLGFIPTGDSVVTLGQLFNDAMNRLDPPVHDFTINPAGKQLVQFPSLFWVDPTYWNTQRTDTATNGNVSLTVTLTPYETEWDPGDGSDPVVCDGPGEVWERGLKGDTFYCKHTYRSVKDQPFTLTSTLRFEIGYETNSTENLGPLPALERIDTQETGAREIQVVETSE